MRTPPIRPDRQHDPTPAAIASGTLLALTLTGLGLAAAACSDDPMQPVRTSLEDNRAHWEAQGISSYVYDFRRECFCLPEAVRPVVIRVIDGAVAEIELAETGESVPEEEHDRYPTIDDLFDQIEDAIDREAHEISVAYHPDLGYPTDAFIDFEETVIDEERGFTASDLRSLEAELLGHVSEMAVPFGRGAESGRAIPPPQNRIGTRHAM